MTFYFLCFPKKFIFKYINGIHRTLSLLFWDTFQSICRTDVSVHYPNHLFDPHSSRCSGLHLISCYYMLSRGRLLALWSWWMNAFVVLTVTHMALVLCERSFSQCFPVFLSIFSEWVCPYAVVLLQLGVHWLVFGENLYQLLWCICWFPTFSCIAGSLSAHCWTLIVAVFFSVRTVNTDHPQMIRTSFYRN